MGAAVSFVQPVLIEGIFGGCATDYSIGEKIEFIKLLSELRCASNYRHIFL